MLKAKRCGAAAWSKRSVPHRCSTLGPMRTVSSSQYSSAPLGSSDLQLGSHRRRMTGSWISDQTTCRLAATVCCPSILTVTSTPLARLVQLGRHLIASGQPLVDQIAGLLGVPIAECLERVLHIPLGDFLDATEGDTLGDAVDDALGHHPQATR